MLKRFESLVADCIAKGASDLHLTGGHPVIQRINGRVVPGKDVWRHDEVDSLAEAMLSPAQKAVLRRRWSADFALSLSGVRLRVNVFSSTRGLSFAVRFLPGRLPTIENMNLHPTLKDFATLESGLVLFCGSTGSGKTTTIAALLNEINRSRRAHVVTLEDPVEYRFRSIKSFMEQRELGTHFPSFAQGLLDVLRQAPDVILVGELREPETIRLTLNAAESGHLVFATLHASTAEEALYRICNAFPLETQDFVRHQLSSSLEAIIIQQLALTRKPGFPVPLLSILRSTQAVRSTIRENKLSQIEGIIDIGRREGMYTFQRYRKEFLTPDRIYVPPSVSFKPAPGNLEKDVASRMVDYNAWVPGEAAAPGGRIPGDPGAGGDPYVVEHDDLEAAIADIEARGNPEE